MDPGHQVFVHPLDRDPHQWILRCLSAHGRLARDPADPAHVKSAIHVHPVLPTLVPDLLHELGGQAGWILYAHGDLREPSVEIPMVATLPFDHGCLLAHTTASYPSGLSSVPKG